MILSKNDCQILRLAEEFYNTYPNPPYTEMLKKRQRAYTCLLFQIHHYFVCIPFRSQIAHSYAYHFKKSIRSSRCRSGLDYTKIVIIKDIKYLGDQEAFVDKDEFNETMINLSKIKRDSLNYIEDYTAHVSGKRKLHPEEFRRRYAFSSLPYFHKELGLEEEHK